MCGIGNNLFLCVIQFQPTQMQEALGHPEPLLVKYLSNAYVHGLDTRNKNHLYLSTISLTCVQRGVLYSGVKIFNSLPKNIQKYKGDRVKFKKELSKYLIIHTFYSITEFLNLELTKGMCNEQLILL